MSAGPLKGPRFIVLGDDFSKRLLAIGPPSAIRYPKGMIGVAGLLVFLGLGWLLSVNRQSIRWRTVVGAFLAQVLLGTFVFGVP